MKRLMKRVLPPMPRIFLRVKHIVKFEAYINMNRKWVWVRWTSRNCTKFPHWAIDGLRCCHMEVNAWCCHMVGGVVILELLRDGQSVYVNAIYSRGRIHDLLLLSIFHYRLHCLLFQLD